MTYEERKAEAMSMTLEELIFNYHWAMDTAENRKERELEDMTTRLEVVTHDRDELVNDLHEYEASADRMQEELYIAQKDRDRLEKELREIKSND